MNRYYVKQSSWFDSHPYDIDKIKEAVKKGGGKQIRTSNQFGWSNQPKVVCFNCEPDKLNEVNISLEKSLETKWIIYHLKDW